MLLFALHTGVRMGEQRALKWSDIDFKRRMITVQRSSPKWLVGVAEFLDDWYYDYPFDNGQAIPSPRGEPFWGSFGQNARGNLNARLPLYKGESSLPREQAHEPFPQPAWARASNSWLGVGGFRCARDDR